MNSVNRRLRLSALGLLAFTIGGCSVGPNYKQPELGLPSRYGESTTRPSGEATRWWSTFKDPTLDSLVARATQNNLDLQLATARIREARAQRGVENAGFFPAVDAIGNYDHQRISRSTANNFTGGGGGSGGGFKREFDFWEVGFDSTWEVDVFGGVRRAVEAADADIQASVEDRRDVLVTLLGDVARNYIELRGRQRQLSITRANLLSQQETLDLTRARFNAGLVGELDVARAQALVATTSAQVPAFEALIRQSIHRLGVLLGQEPSALAAELGPEGPIPLGVGLVPVGLPSDLLRHRADVRRAERQLAAQTARIGVATADLFPRFTLTGSFGWQSERFKDLADDDSLAWHIGPGVRWNIFDAGKIRSNINVQDARQEQALVQYRQVVLTSLEDVENALVNYDREQTRRVALAAAVDSNRRAVELANQLYSRGLVDYLNVQEAQRSLLAAEDQLVQSDTAVSSNLVALYKALGGGWEAMEQPKSD
jgi:NodT family efflux transporter outer membrane factor (OMF) lipoprotein